MKGRKRALRMLACLVLATQACVVQAATTSIAGGFDYSSGDYGDTERTEILYLPLSVKYDTGNWSAKLTVPWLHVRAPSGTVIVDGRPVSLPGVATRTSESGLGDIVLTGTYAAYENAWSGLAIDVQGKVKLPTADESRGLGSGETDYALGLDMAKSFGEFTVLATLGYRWIGDPPGVALEDVWFGSLGLARRFTPDWSGGVIYDYRQSAVSGSAPQSDATFYASRRIGAALKAQMYGIVGFSNGSPDWGLGAVLTRSF